MRSNAPLLEIYKLDDLFLNDGLYLHNHIHPFSCVFLFYLYVVG